MPCIQGHYASRREVRTYRCKKLTGCKLKWNIWLLKGINGDNIIRFVGCVYICSPILNMNMQIRLVHSEILASDVDNRGIDLDPINRNRPIYTGKLVGNGASSEANDANAV